MTLFFCFNSSVVVGDSRLSTWQKAYCQNLRALAAGNLEYSSNNNSNLKMAASIPDSKTAIPAIFELWIQEKVDVEYFWWVQEDRATRCFILSLFPKAIHFPEDRPRPVFVGPNFDTYIDRFNSKEKQERNEEKDFVIQHLSSIAGLIIESIEKKGLKTDNINQKIILETYKENIGSKLPFIDK